MKNDPESVFMVDPDELRAFCLALMGKANLNARSAEITADVLVKTDKWGVYTHGTRQLPKLLENFETGKMVLNASAAVVAEGPSWAVIDGNRAMAFDAGVDAMQMAIDKAKLSGCATTTARNVGHFGGAGYYANMAAEAGLIGLATCNVDPGMAVPGSKGPVLGTNPIAYGIPTSGRPIFFDVATSAVAATKVYRAKAKGETVPDGWLVDKDGVPTNDPSNYPEDGALLPFAGHKGYGLALLVEVLCAGLSGGPSPEELNSWVTTTPEPVNQSFTFIAINPGSFRSSSEFIGYIDSLERHIKEADKAAGAERIYLPGEMEWENYRIAEQHGISLPPDVIGTLRTAARKYEVGFPQNRWERYSSRT